MVNPDITSALLFGKLKHITSGNSKTTVGVFVAIHGYVDSRHKIDMIGRQENLKIIRDCLCRV